MPVQPRQKSGLGAVLNNWSGLGNGFTKPALGFTFKPQNGSTVRPESRFPGKPGSGLAGKRRDHPC